MFLLLKVVFRNKPYLWKRKEKHTVKRIIIKLNLNFVSIASAQIEGLLWNELRIFFFLKVVRTANCRSALYGDLAVGARYQSGGYMESCWPDI